MKKIVILGEAAVGKTSLINALLQREFHKSYLMTVGFERESYIAKFNDKEMNFSLWDSAGQESMRISRQVFYQGVMGALLVYDLTRPTTLDKLEKWIHELNQYLEPNTPILLIGTKCDLSDYIIIEDETIEEFKDKWNLIASFKVSSITGENIREIFNLIINWS